MENEILETVTAPEVEVQPTVEVQENVAVESIATTTKCNVKQNVITTCLKKVADKGKELISDPKDLWKKIKAAPKKIWIISGSALVALVAALVVLTLLSNTYKTPIRLLEDATNTKKASKVYDKRIAALNGFCESECEDILGIFKKTEAYEDEVEIIEKMIAKNKELYGENYKYRLEIIAKEEVDQQTLTAVCQDLRVRGTYLLAERENMGSDDYEQIANRLGITQSKAKKLVKYEKRLAQILKDAEIEEGYKLTVEIAVTGSKANGVEPIQETIYVYKIDGRWVSDEAITLLFEMLAF